MKMMKIVILEMIQRALHINELVGRRFRASKANEATHEHNHGIHWSNYTYVHHPLPMNVYMHWDNYNMFFMLFPRKISLVSYLFFFIKDFIFSGFFFERSKKN